MALGVLVLGFVVILVVIIGAIFMVSSGDGKDNEKADKSMIEPKYRNKD